MTSLTESTAVFSERATEVGLDDATKQLLVDQGITTLSKLAFAVGQPGETPTDQAVRGLIADGGDPQAVPLGRVSSLRRLLFESQTLVVSQVKNMIEQRSDEVKAELAPAERNDRINKQKTRMAGTSLTGELECGHVCYDNVMKMLQGNSVVYLPPHKFVARKAEVGLDKPKKELTIESNTTVTVKDKQHDISCDTSSDLLLQEALTRRALALDLVGVATYSVVNTYNRFLMDQLKTDPPVGCSKVSIQQVLRADKEAFLRMAEKLTNGIKRRADGTNPMDTQFQELQSDPKVVFHLLPLPMSSSSHSSNSNRDTKGNTSAAPMTNQGKGQGFGGKGKGKKRKWRAPRNMPPALANKQSETKNGKPLCWNFNLPHGCSSGKPAGDQCDKGLHLCMGPGCQKQHPLHKHSS